jgi:hypothetical protein
MKAPKALLTEFADAWCKRMGDIYIQHLMKGI